MSIPTWTGRVDAEDPGATIRWHQHVKPFDESAHGGVVLIGFAVDEGVRRNGGRPGATAGPQALRQALANIPLLGAGDIRDAGDVQCLGGQLEFAQTELATRVATILGQNGRPLILGGGHELAWGTFQGIMLARPELKRLLIVNFDAHFDLRQADKPNSGTPFLQISQWCRSNERAFLYHVLGISRFANTQALFERAASLGAQHVLDEALQTPSGVERALQNLRARMSECDAIHLSFCLDVLPQFQAPGVSAPAPLGVPLANALNLLGPILATGKVIAADIAEFNPSFDPDGHTARTAARIAATVAHGAMAA